MAPSFGAIIRKIRKAVAPFRAPAVTTEARENRDPFRVLISCLISLRTKDEVTAAASTRLFRQARTPKELLKLSGRQIERLIFPAGFYRTKARTMRQLAQTLVEKHGGEVPNSLEELLELKGVGRKTANLVVTMAFGKPGICVDTHVHRISNRLGWVRTKTPEQTEFALRDTLPRRYWIELNDLLVTFGQNICQPVSPWCSRCSLEKSCPKIGVMKRR